MYGYTMRVAQDIGTYQAMHQAVVELMGDNSDGLILHVAAPSATGFEVTEVWQSKDLVDAFNRDVLPAAMQKAGVTMDPADVQVTEFDPVVVITPGPFSSDS